MNQPTGMNEHHEYPIAVQLVNAKEKTRLYLARESVLNRIELFRQTINFKKTFYMNGSKAHWHYLRDSIAGLFVNQYCCFY